MIGIINHLIIFYNTYKVIKYVYKLFFLFIKCNNEHFWIIVIIIRVLIMFHIEYCMYILYNVVTVSISFSYKQLSLYFLNPIQHFESVHFVLAILYGIYFFNNDTNMRFKSKKNLFYILIFMLYYHFIFTKSI